MLHSLNIVKEKIKEIYDPLTVLQDLGVERWDVSGEAIRCPCPIHQGDGYNFSWNLQRGLFTCFSHRCGEDVGLPRDVFLLVMLVKNMSFPQSIRYLAGLTGIIIDSGSYNKVEDDEYKVKKWLRKQRSMEGNSNRPINEAILSNFSKKYPQYLLNRGFDTSILEEFEIAYADSGPFEGRIVVPIRDEDGRLVGFSGRLATNDKKILAKKYKYKHMANFSSGVTLYGLDKAKPYIERDGCLILVEGFFDVMRAAQAGIRNICATMGVAILPEQIDLVVEHTDTVYLAYDGDNAGRVASWKVYDKLKKYCDVRFMDMPDGKDVGDTTEMELWTIYSNPIRAIEFYNKYKFILKEGGVA